MSTEASAAAALVAAGAVAFAVTPLMARLARRLGLLDHPTGYKGHERPTPYLGGMAILLSVAAATLAVAGTASPIPALGAGAAIICLLGTIDDLRPVPLSVRLAVQAGVGAGVWALDAGWATTLPPAGDLLLTVASIVVAANALNLIDNLDGTAASVAAASAFGLVGIALVTGAQTWAIVIAAALAGACLAFLPYNLAKPTRLFLGDGGSTLLGFLIAVAAMGALATRPSWGTSIVAGALLIGVPLVEVALVTVSRRRQGAPLLVGARDHLTHRLQARVGSARRVAARVGTAQAALAALVLLAVQLGSPAIIAAAALYALAAAGVIWGLEMGRWAETADGVVDQVALRLEGPVHARPR